MPDRIPILDRAACDGITARVFELERFWTRRHPDLPSFTLGATAYLDIPAGGMPRYLVTKSGGNKVLQRHFGELLHTVASALAGALGAPTFLSDRFALPGFHIYLHHPALARVEPIVHFDLQDLDLEIEGARRDGARCSFTVPIRIPAGGGGINVWELAYAEVAGLTADGARALAASRPVTRHEYQVGELFLHSGDQLHQNRDLALAGGRRPPHAPGSRPRSGRPVRALLVAAVSGTRTRGLSPSCRSRSRRGPRA